MNSYEATTQALGGNGYGGFGNSFLETLIALKLIDDKDKNCCEPGATCKDVWSVDKDVLAAENHLAHDICELGHDIDTKIDTVNASIKDVAYAQAMQMSQLKNDMTAGFGEVKALIVSTQCQSDLKAAEAKACALQSALDKAELIAALSKGKE